MGVKKRKRKAERAVRNELRRRKMERINRKKKWKGTNEGRKEG